MKVLQAEGRPSRFGNEGILGVRSVPKLCCSFVGGPTNQVDLYHTLTSMSVSVIGRLLRLPGLRSPIPGHRPDQTATFRAASGARV